MNFSMQVNGAPVSPPGISVSVPGISLSLGGLSIGVSGGKPQGSINLFLDKPYYLSGELVTGRIDVSIGAPVTTSGIKLKWKGFERTLIEETYTEHNHETNQAIKRKRKFKQSRTFFNQEVLLYQAPGNVLPPGQFSVNFQYQLPSNLPGVFYDDRRDNFDDDTVRAAIIYSVKAFLDMPGKDLKTKQRFIVSEAVTRQIVALHEEVKKSFLMSFSRGELHMVVDIAKNVFIPGETIPIHVKINNQSAKDVKALKVKLMRDLVVRAEGKTNTTRITVNSVTFNHQIPQKNGKFEGDLVYQMPADIYPSTDGQLIDCTYHLDVECDVPMAVDLEAHPKILVALLPSQGQPFNLFSKYTKDW